ncbi:2OG-Fe dioxygenase family protein [Actinomycetospora cinnamomea]|uniref:2OG-Fe dioxygenase family protein n=1 Tax=Actinomycetospora cinnamomea TaxID=663609 RepID=UPI001A9C5A6D|nr:2OG-Fe dioxygenase family protein [Actinomycetospora cinnamomea]
MDGAVARAREEVASIGAHVLPQAEVLQFLGLDETGWAGFAGHWEDLRPDPYAARSGTQRLRRYGRFVVSPEGRRELAPADEFRQPKDSNRLFLDEGRVFEPLTDQFLADPVLDGLLELLGGIAGALDDPARWVVHVHPFRVLGSADSRGDATPEGRHQDGVTLVSSLLVGRENAAGGTSEVVDEDGREILTTTLAEPATLLVGDDRRTWHGVDLIRPVDPGTPARRDVLVVTFMPEEGR